MGRPALICALVLPTRLKRGLESQEKNVGTVKGVKRADSFPTWVQKVLKANGSTRAAHLQKLQYLWKGDWALDHLEGSQVASFPFLFLSAHVFF